MTKNRLKILNFNGYYQPFSSQKMLELKLPAIFKDASIKPNLYFRTILGRFSLLCIQIQGGTSGNINDKNILITQKIERRPWDTQKIVAANDRHPRWQKT